MVVYINKRSQKCVGINFFGLCIPFFSFECYPGSDETYDISTFFKRARTKRKTCLKIFAFNGLNATAPDFLTTLQNKTMSYNTIAFAHIKFASLNILFYKFIFSKIIFYLLQI